MNKNDDKKLTPVFTLQHPYLRALRELSLNKIEDIYRVGYHHDFGHRLVFTANSTNGRLSNCSVRCLDCDYSNEFPLSGITLESTPAKRPTKIYWFRYNGKWSQIA